MIFMQNEEYCAKQERQTLTHEQATEKMNAINAQLPVQHRYKSLNEFIYINLDKYNIVHTALH